MNELKLIDEREVLGKEFKIYGDFENPLFLAKDVAEWIEHTDTSTMVKSIDEDEKLIQTILVSGQRREVIMLTENGLYEVLMQSRKEVAKQFKKKVKEILKDIRKNGMYAKDELLDNPDLLIQVATKLKEEKEHNKKLLEKIEQDKPKVIFADSVSASEDTILVRELAKILNQNGIKTGEKRLYQDLRKKGFLIKKGSDRNMPTQKSIDMKLFELTESTINRPDGKTILAKTTRVTGKGQQYFINLFKA